MDRDPVGYARTIQGEHAMQAETLRRNAQKLRSEANDLDRAAEWQEQRAAWAGELADRYEVAQS